MADHVPLIRIRDAGLNRLQLPLLGFDISCYRLGGQKRLGALRTASEGVETLFRFAIDSDG